MPTPVSPLRVTCSKVGDRISLIGLRLFTCDGSTIARVVPLCFVDLVNTLLRLHDVAEYRYFQH